MTSDGGGVTVGGGVTLQGRGKKGDGRCRRRPNRPPGGRTGWHRRFDLSIALAWTRPDHDGRGNGGTTDPPPPRPHPRWDRQPPRRPQVVTPAPSPRTCLSTVAAGAGGRGGWGGGRSAKSPVMRALALSTSTAPLSPSLASEGLHPTSCAPSSVPAQSPPRPHFRWQLDGTRRASRGPSKAPFGGPSRGTRWGLVRGASMGLPIGPRTFTVSHVQ